MFFTILIANFVKFDTFVRNLGTVNSVVLYTNKNWLFRTVVSRKYMKFVKFPNDLRETLKEAIPQNSRLRENLATWRACQIQGGGSIYGCSVSAN